MTVKQSADDVQMDSRVESYLEAVDNNIGLLSRSTGGIKSALDENGIEYEVVDSMTRDYAGMSGGETMEVIKYDAQSMSGNVYAVQYTSRVAIDDVQTVVLQFDSKPSKTDVKTAEAVRSTRTEFEFGSLSESFNCWECGKETHVLDALDNDSSGASRIVKIEELAKECYCGC